METVQNTLICRCIEKYRDKNGVIKGYLLEDTKGNKQQMEANELKYYIRVGQIKVDNLKLTSDNKLIDDKGNEDKNPAPVFSQRSSKNSEENLMEKISILSNHMITQLDCKYTSMTQCSIVTEKLLGCPSARAHYDYMKYKSLWKNIDKYNNVDIYIEKTTRAMDSPDNLKIKGQNLIDYTLYLWGTHSNDGRQDWEYTSVSDIINQRLDKAELEIYRYGKSINKYQTNLMDKDEFTNNVEWIIAVLIWYTLKETTMLKADSKTLADKKESSLKLILRQINRVKNEYRFIEAIVRKVLSGEVNLKETGKEDELEQEQMNKIHMNKEIVNRQFRDNPKKGIMDLFKR